MTGRGTPPLYPRDAKSWQDLLERHAEGAGFSCQDPQGLARVLLTLYASMLEDTTRRLNRAPEKHRLAFLNCAQVPRLPARSAQTAVVFQVADGYGESIPIPKNTLVCAESETGDPVLFRVKEDFAALPVHLREVCWADIKRDVFRLAYRGGDFEPFTPWEGPSGGQHSLDLTFRNVFCNMGGTHQVRLTGEITGADLETLADSQAFRWSLEAEGAECPVEAIPAPDGALCVTLEDFPVTPATARLRLELADPAYMGVKLKDLRAAARKNEMVPTVIQGDRRLDSDCFYPFGQPLESYGECHIFCSEALFRPGAEITITFDLEMDILEERLPNEPEAVDFKWIMRRPAPKPEPAVSDACAGDVRWEYWNGGAYCAIPAQTVPETRYKHPEKQISLTFSCPADMALRELGEYSGYCLRLSCGVCSDLYRLPRRVHTPRIARLRMAYEIAPCPPERAVAVNFGEAREQPPASLAPFSPPPCPPGESRALYLGLEGLPANGYLRILFCLDGFTGAGDPVACSLANGPEGESVRLNAFDETRGLTCSGIISCIAPPHPKKTFRFGAERYWLCITPPAETATPRIMGIYLNAQRVQNRVRNILEMEVSQIPLSGEVSLAPNAVAVWVWITSSAAGLGENRTEQWREYTPLDGKFRGGFYRMDYARGVLTLPEDARAPFGDVRAKLVVYYDVSDGVRGNVPALAVNSLYNEIPFIDRVYNPMASVDGSEGEPDAAMADRVEHLLYCGGRAVTERDFELLAVDKCPLVHRAKCVADKGIRLGVLLRAEEAFPQVRAELEALFQSIGCAEMYGQKVEIVSAAPIPIICRLTVPQKMAARLGGLRERLARYADPVSGGGGQGWEIGTMPDERQLRARTEDLLKELGTDIPMIDFSCEIGGPGLFGVPGELTLLVGEEE